MDVKRSIRPRKVLIAFQVINTASLDTLAGIIRYIRTSTRWSTQILTFPNVFSADILRSAPTRDIDGVILHQPVDDELCEAILRSTIPIVVIGNSNERLKRRRKAISFVDADNRKIGQMAALHYLQMGKFRSFGFLPDIPHTRWSKLRLDGFAAELRAHRIATSVFHSRHPEKSVGYCADLKSWIDGLTSPTAVLLAGDYRATDFFTACSAAGKSIPADVSVLGVDNNVAICDTLAPPLSSVEPSFEEEGYEAAKTLDRLMKRALPATRAVRIGPAGIIERKSTSSKSSGASLVDRALRYISSRCDHPIAARDVAAQLGISQQLLALRFRQLVHRSVRETIIATRLEKVAHLLQRTDLGISSIAKQCGFRSGNYLTHVFTRYRHVSPTEFRRRAGRSAH